MQRNTNRRINRMLVCVLLGVANIKLNFKPLNLLESLFRQLYILLGKQPQFGCEILNFWL